MKTFLLTSLLFLGLVLSASAQITVPNTLVAGATITSAGLNTNFSTIGNHALDRLAGGNIAGNVTADPGITIDGIDIGATVCVTCAPTFKDLILTSPATGLTVAGNVIVNSTGKIPAISSTYFTSLSGANLTSLTAANISAGTATITVIGNVTGNLTGNVTGNITGTAPAGTLTGATLASNVLASSLTSVGTIASGTWSGSFGAVSGFNLTSLTASNISNGTLLDARLSGNVPLINAANVWTGVTNGFQGDINVGVNAGGGMINIQGRPAQTASSLTITGGAFGAGALSGPYASVGRNSSGSGAPGAVVWTDRVGAVGYIWLDTTGVFRTQNGPPTETSGDLIGTVVGLQSSALDTKNLLGNDLEPFDALDIMLHTPVRQFVYKSGAYSGTAFQGIIADWSPEFAMDPDAKHPNGRSFNPVSAFGYTVESIKALQAEIDELKADIAALKAAR